MAERPATDHDDRPTDRPWTDHGPVSLEEAAERLGVTVNAVRQRLKRGTLNGHKTPDGWVVVWPPAKPTDHGPTIDAAWSATDRPTSDHRPTDQPTNGRPTADRATDHAPAPDAARRQAELIRDEWLAPLVAQIREQAEAIGRLEAERAAVAEERDRLRAERDSDRRLADRLVDLLQLERDGARSRVAELETVVGALAGGAAGRNGHRGALLALWSRLRRMTDG